MQQVLLSRPFCWWESKGTEKWSFSSVVTSRWWSQFWSHDGAPGSPLFTLQTTASCKGLHDYRPDKLGCVLLIMFPSNIQIHTTWDWGRTCRTKPRPSCPHWLLSAPWPGIHTHPLNLLLKLMDKEQPAPLPHSTLCSSLRAWISTWKVTLTHVLSSVTRLGTCNTQRLFLFCPLLNSQHPLHGLEHRIIYG